MNNEATGEYTYWKVHSRRDGRTYEICAVMNNFSHGFASYGWTHPDKKHCIFSGVAHYDNIAPNDEQWRVMMDYAKKYVHDLNVKHLNLTK
jgi:hypothetical protein